jgi:hypothetical protein
MAGTRREEFWAAVAQREAEIVARHRVTDQFKRAWEIIAPDPVRQGECEHRIVYAILLIQREVLATKRSTTRTTAEVKKDLKKRIKKLRAAEAAVRDEHLADRLTDERAGMEETLAHLDKYAVVQKGRPPRSKIREAAVHQAHELLCGFGSKRPSLYRDGAWHNLAKVLFGNEDADLFGYLERHSPPLRWYEVGPDGSEIEVQDPPLWLLSTIVGERR